MKKLTSKRLRAEFMKTKFDLGKAKKQGDAEQIIRLEERLIAQAQVLLVGKQKTFDEFLGEVYNLCYVASKEKNEATNFLNKFRLQVRENTLQEIVTQL